MDIRRIMLVAACGMLSYTLWTAWQKDYPEQHTPTEVPAVISTHTGTHTPGSILPVLKEDGSTSASGNQSQTGFPELEGEQQENSRLVSIKTDVLDLKIDLNQGDVIGAQLLDYPESIAQKDKPFTLLNNRASTRYVANSNILVVDQQALKHMVTEFSSESKNYTLEANQDQLIVSLTGKTNDGISVKKEFVFKRGSYLIDVQYVLNNKSDAAWKGYMNTQLLRTLPKEDKSSPFHVGSYTGASYSSPGHHRYEKVTFKDMDKHALDTDVEGGWYAMQQHYFLTAWIPFANEKNRFYTRTVDGSYAIGSMSQPIYLKSGEQQTVGSKLYLGPETADVLKGIAPGLDLTIDYGWLWFISSLIFSLMSMIYQVVGNWGWSIVLVTLLIKLAFYRLSAKSYRSMAGMRQLQPKLEALREKFGDDKAKMSQATMALYKTEKINPLSGCLPMIVQIPVFIALYWVLAESVELRQAPFILWIHDLASPDPWHVLPLIMGATMFIQQRLNPTPPDPMQAKLMMFLPVLFTGLFWNFPAGLVLYWTVNNTLTILQQWYITRQHERNAHVSTKKARLLSK
ncbi:MAG: membrane protein insertase YidC [Legionellaceae bacterium]|nr:membrane protein insertase YidC [Legionellaceae bacterium]